MSPALRAFALLSLPAVLAGLLSLGTSKLVASPEPTQWVIWGDTAFSSPASFARWLRRHGASYNEWAREHPAAAARLEGRAAPQADPAPEHPRAAVAIKAKPERRTQGSASGRRASSAQAHTEAGARRAADPAGSSGGLGLMLLALVVVAIALVAVASLPLPLLEAMRAPGLVYQHRLEFGVTGASIALGMGAAQLLT